LPRLSTLACTWAQILDDSTDKGTRDLVDDKVAEWRERGVECEVRRRTNRAGYKAGALHEVSHVRALVCSTAWCSCPCSLHLYTAAAAHPSHMLQLAFPRCHTTSCSLWKAERL